MMLLQSPASSSEEIRKVSSSDREITSGINVEDQLLFEIGIDYGILQVAVDNPHELVHMQKSQSISFVLSTTNN